jgi:hypothetical protein
MDPTAPEPGTAVAPHAERLSPEAAWGMRALIMVLMFLLRWIGSGPSPSTDEVAEPVEGHALPDPNHRAERAQRVARGTIAATSQRAAAAPTTPVDADGAAANRRRALYASALTAAGTAAWVAGRRSGGRR